MYHDVVSSGMEDSSGFPGRDAARYKMTPERFESHLAAISRQAHTDSPVMTFDDGGVSAIGAADALERHGLRGHFFVTVNYIGTRGFLDPSGIRELRRRGHEIGSHSCSHPLRMGHLPQARLREEWNTSRAALCDILGEDVRAASIPGGDFSPEVATAAAEARFTRLFTSEPIVVPRLVGLLTGAGRFTIRRSTSATTAAALAAGRWLPSARQAAFWNVKKLGKQVGGERYLQLRGVLLGRDPDMQWGDKEWRCRLGHNARSVASASKASPDDRLRSPATRFHACSMSASGTSGMPSVSQRRCLSPSARPDSTSHGRRPTMWRCSRNCRPSAYTRHASAGPKAELAKLMRSESHFLACWIFRERTPVFAARSGWLKLPLDTVCLEDSVTSPAYRGRGLAGAAWSEIARVLQGQHVGAMITQSQPRTTRRRGARSRRPASCPWR